MSTTPEWLPEIINVDGEWEQVLTLLYRIFESDFKSSKPRLEGLLVWWDRTVKEGGYEEGFWHLITRKNLQIGERLFDPRRAERLPWCAPTINNSYDDAVKVWDYREARNRINTYVWLEEWDYVIIFEKKQMRLGQVAFLVTAYYVDGPSKKRSLYKKHERKET